MVSYPAGLAQRPRHRHMRLLRRGKELAQIPLAGKKIGHLMHQANRCTEPRRAVASERPRSSVCELKPHPKHASFLAIPSLNKALVLELTRCEFLSRKENLLLLGTVAPARLTSPWLSACPPASAVIVYASPLPLRWSAS